MTVLELAVEQLVPEHVDALVVVTDRRNGPASDVADHISTAAIAMRIRMSTSVG